MAHFTGVLQRGLQPVPGRSYMRGISALHRTVALLAAAFAGTLAVNEARGALAEHMLSSEVLQARGRSLVGAIRSEGSGKTPWRGTTVAFVWGEGCRACARAVSGWMLAVSTLRSERDPVRVVSMSKVSNEDDIPLRVLLGRLGVGHVQITDAAAFTQAVGASLVPMTLVIRDGCVVGGIRGVLGERRTARLVAMVRDAAHTAASTQERPCRA